MHVAMGTGAIKRTHTRRTHLLDTANVTQRRPLQVLLVDDDADVLFMLQAVLTSRTIDVVSLATNGEDAVRVASAIAPDVAVVDYMMPGLTGFQTATRLKAVRPDCVVVIFSAGPRGPGRRGARRRPLRAQERHR
jgi:CheY-like chemotaxis protein